MRKEKKKTEALTMEEMSRMHIGAGHVQPPVDAEKGDPAPLPEIEFIKDMGKAVSFVADTACSAVEGVENFLNDCACEVASWDWGIFDILLDGARGYCGEGGELNSFKLEGTVIKGAQKFVFNTIKGTLNLVGHPVQTAEGVKYAVIHPSELVSALKEKYWGTDTTWTQKTSGVTEAICDIAFLIYGVKGAADKLSKGAKTGEAAEEAAKIGEAAKIAEEVEDDTKIGEAAKAAEEGVEAAGGKGKVKIESAGESGINSSNPFYKQGGGSNLDDFMTPHAQKHAYNPNVKSTKNKTQFGENIDVAKLREDTMLHPDEVIYDSKHNMIKYVKEYDFNISTADTPTGSHRVFINLAPKAGKTNRNSQFPYYGGDK